MSHPDHIPAEGLPGSAPPAAGWRPESRTAADSSQASLPVMEHFLTLQGEGFHQGRSAYFIRLGGCDLGCVWCDVKDSWDRHGHPLRSVTELVQHVTGTTAPIAVVTGGEPLLHDLGPLTRALRDKGIRTHLETSGAHPLSGEWDWICLSPKKFKAPLAELMPVADELKVVVCHPSDIDWAERHAAMTGPGCRLSLQPEWDRLERVMPSILGHILAHPEWCLSLQTHKYIRIP